MAVPVDVVPSVRDPDEVDTDLVAGLKADTGFTSYLEYVIACWDQFSSNSAKEGFLGRLQYPPEVDESYLSSLPSHCYIMDLVKDNQSNWSCAMRLSLSSRPDFLHRDSQSGSTNNFPEPKPITEFRAVRYANTLQLDQAILSPIEDCSIRIVFWHIRKNVLPSEWVDIVGLRLQVPLSFFELSLRDLGALERHKFDHQHLVIGRATATMLCDNTPSKAVILIIYLDAEESKDLSIPTVEGILDRELRPKLPSTNLRAEIRAANYPRDQSIVFFEHYQRLFRNALMLDSQAGWNINRLYLLSLVPFFKLASMELQIIHRYSRTVLIRLDKIDADIPENLWSYSRVYDRLERKRFDLRRNIEDFKNSQQSFANVVLERDMDWLNSKAARLMKANSDLVVESAQRMETEIRDYLQIAVSNISVEESRKSIQLSNTQIEEAKQVKLFTILAILYVPLNLATSIFGMNLQQLNQSGQPFWVFVTTAILAMFFTAFVWLCIVQINSVRRWTRSFEAISRKLPDSKTKPDYSIAVRLAILCYSVYHGYTISMLKSNIWFLILTNSVKIVDTEDIIRVSHPLERRPFSCFAGPLMSWRIASYYSRDEPAD